MNWFLVNTNVKTTYRQSILQKRNTLGLSEVSNLSKTILRNADLRLNLSAITTLGSYFSVNNEVDLATLTNIRLKKNLLTTFPKVEPNHSISLIAPKDFKKLRKNKYDIFEPSDGDKVNPIDHEIIIIPTVGVDINGYRLGYGGGYYDRFLVKTQKNVLKVGLSFFEPVDKILNVEEHDIKLDYVITPNRVYNFT